MPGGKGKLVVIEGLDGSGKATQTALLAKRLRAESVDTRTVSFPCYDSQSSALVKMYLGGEFGSKPEDVNAFAASTFYAIDRYASFKTDWGKDYAAGKLILADRYVTSNMVHQCSKIPPAERNLYLDWLEDFEYNRMGIPRPDLVIFLATDPELNEKLLEKRYHNDEAKKDIHERNVEHLKKSREAALHCALKYSWKTIRCCERGAFRPIESIAEEIYHIVRGVF